MASSLPLRLLSLENGELVVIDNPGQYGIAEFDILSYRWGTTVSPYQCGIRGVDWDVTIRKERLRDIKNLMETAGIRYLWADCVCVRQAPGAGNTDNVEKAAEVARMYEYYKAATTCHIMLEMDHVWNPETVVNDFKLVDHVLDRVSASAKISTGNVSPQDFNQLREWAENRSWSLLPITRAAVAAAALDLGVLNCYATCVNQVRSLFDNLYFTRVWTFQEMLLGRNVTMWAIKDTSVACLGPFDTWKDLADHATDKAVKLLKWIERSHEVTPKAVERIMVRIADDVVSLTVLQTQVKGINSAQIDIVNGGAHWWYENYKGVANVFSAVSLSPRDAFSKPDIFLGLLGVFSGLFPLDEIQRYVQMADAQVTVDMEEVSFNFFRRLSTMTGLGWARLAIGSHDRDGNGWGWIPVMAKPTKLMTTDCFAGVINLGRLDNRGRVRTNATTGIQGAPRWYMKIRLTQQSDDYGYRFVFRGCNCGKKLKTGTFRSELIPTRDRATSVAKDETARKLVECATWLSCLFNPNGNIIAYRRRLLRKLRPDWTVVDNNARLPNWIDRCVGGAWLEDPHPFHVRVHNESAHNHFVHMTSFGSRLENDNTKNVTCRVEVNCGCVIEAPYAMMMEAILAVDGTSLGEVAVRSGDDDRIILQDGLGLVQVGEVDQAFQLINFGGDNNAHRVYAAGCRKTKKLKKVIPKPSHQWPRGRAIVRDDFKHSSVDILKDYGFVATGGSGNLLICRSNPVEDYRIVGVCIDENMESRIESKSVAIR
ncbi:heterokaryon incompatibility protein-domain-containing protein [Schizothecium vesticola]|uniref:Heterokaryon incompatibility protein-domain-containing protein n=1 Tax=Schizothecium vesticola TaxID=314040 RepID=A0AA40EUL6_9PEZI|nr:heterokaryon incompatibility protein-domain-containing protein [Schizothecium vesticola]